MSRRVFCAQELFSFCLWTHDNRQSPLPPMKIFLKFCIERDIAVSVYNSTSNDSFYHEISPKINIITDGKSCLECSSENTTGLIFVDSIDNLLMDNISKGEFLRWLCDNKKKSQGLWIYAASNRMLTSKQFLRQLNTISSCTLDIFHWQRYLDGKHNLRYIALQTEKKEYDLVDYEDNQPSQFFTELSIKKSSGKYHKEECLVSIWQDGSDIDITPLETMLKEAEMKSMKTTESIQQIKNPEINHQVSFNLSLTKEQQESRANVSLPYMQAQDKTASVNNSPQIFYSMDDVDDFDDEDPDADLEI